jgi:hypothetical protein
MTAPYSRWLPDTKPQPTKPDIKFWTLGEDPLMKPKSKSPEAMFIARLKASVRAARTHMIAFSDDPDTAYAMTEGEAIRSINVYGVELTTKTYDRSRHEHGKTTVIFAPAALKPSFGINPPPSKDPKFGAVTTSPFGIGSDHTNQLIGMIGSKPL